MSSKQKIHNPANTEKENTQQEQAHELSMEELHQIAGGGLKQQSPTPATNLSDMHFDIKVNKASS